MLRIFVASAALVAVTIGLLLHATHHGAHAVESALGDAMASSIALRNGAEINELISDKTRNR
jgi:hypothetical protein